MISDDITEESRLDTSAEEDYLLSAVCYIDGYDNQRIFRVCKSSVI